MSDWREQEVRNESRSRDRNEWIAETRGVVALDHETEELFVCECSDPACRARITLSRIEYEMIKAALREHQGRVESAAKSLGISRKGLYLKRQRLGL